jgi:hypothetical protein
MTVIDRRLSARGVKHGYLQQISTFCYRNQSQLHPTGTVAERADQYTHLLVLDVWQHRGLHLYPSWLYWRLTIPDFNDHWKSWAVSLVLAVPQYESRFTEYTIWYVFRVVNSVVRTPVVFPRYDESHSHYPCMWHQCIEKQHWPTRQPRPLLWVVYIAWTNGIPSPDTRHRTKTSTRQKTDRDRHWGSRVAPWPPFKWWSQCAKTNIWGLRSMATIKVTIFSFEMRLQLNPKLTDRQSIELTRR